TTWSPTTAATERSKRLLLRRDWRSLCCDGWPSSGRIWHQFSKYSRDALANVVSEHSIWHICRISLHPGRSHDIRLGDVVVSCPDGENGGIIHYNKGKIQQDGFQRVGQMNRPPPILLSAVAELRLERRSRNLYTETIRNTISQRLDLIESLDIQPETLTYQGT